MPEEVTYYNEEYSPIADDYLAAQARENLGTVQERNEHRAVNTQKRPRSRYDEHLYSLPNLDNDDDDDHSPTVLTPITTRTSSRKKVIWRIVAIIIIFFGILGVTAVVSKIYLVPDQNGKCEYIHNIVGSSNCCFMQTYCKINFQFFFKLPPTHHQQ